MFKKDANLIRPLGPNERFQAARYALDLYVGNIVACRYAIPDPVSMRQDELEPFFDRVLAHTVLEHAVLQTGLMRYESRKPYWVHLESVHLQHHVTWVDATATEDYDSLFSRISREQRETKFPDLSRQPGWRIVAIKHEARRFLEIVFCYNHTLGDGMSGRIFHESLLRHLNSPNSAAHASLPMLDGRSFKTNTRTNRLLPPQEKLAAWTMGIRCLAETAIDEMRPFEFKPRITDATWAPIRPSNTGIQFRTLNIPAGVLGHVLNACRSHGTTMTGLINALVLVSLSRRLSEKDARAFQSVTPISTRPLLKSSSQSHGPTYDPDRTMGNMVTIMHHNYGPDLVASIRKQDAANAMPFESLLDIIWSVSAGVRREIREHVDSGLRNKMLSIMSLVSDWRKYHRDETKAPRAASWLLTNLVTIDGDPQQSEAAARSTRWTIDRAMFQLSADVSGSFFQVCPVAVKGKDLTIDISWQDEVVDRSLGEGLVEDVNMMLMHIGSRQ